MAKSWKSSCAWAMKAWRSSPATGGRGRRFTAAARSRKRASISSTSNEAMAATVGQECSAGCGSSTRDTSSVASSPAGRRQPCRAPCRRRRRPVVDGRVVRGRGGLDLGRRARRRRPAPPAAWPSAAGRRGRGPGSVPVAARPPGAPHRACGTGRRRRGGATQRSPITSSGPSERLSVRVARTSQTAVQIMAMPTTTRRLASTIVVDPVEPRRGGAPDTSALIMPGSALVGRAPDRRASADDVATQLATVARAAPDRRPARPATACRCGCRRVAA